jgi:2-oxoglutarate ferredoxin oxidoreductase subunit gamma
VSFRYEVRLSGEGGQGLVLAGKILTQAAAIHGGLNATQSQSYGPEARGGASRSEVIISDEDIDYPKAINVDLLLSLTQQSFDSYHHDLKANGIAVLDSTTVTRTDGIAAKTVKVPIAKLAEEKLGRALFTNLVALGVVVGVSKIVSIEAVQKAIAELVPKGTEEKNLKAFEIGLEEAAKA